jgi:hypothetical protein
MITQILVSGEKIELHCAVGENIHLSADMNRGRYVKDSLGRD